jgi:carbon-monoxide dehydrogenase small subunit
MHEQSVDMTVNSRPQRSVVEPRLTLADFLREKCGLTGTHLGCEHGACGACTVLLDGQAVRSCLIFAVQADGQEVTTVEGIAGEDGELSPVQAALRECHGLQCDEIREGLSGNFCRCTGYQGIISAVHRAAQA